jgi:glycosyltransferase involved in cell wall biosynthesis
MKHVLLLTNSFPTKSSSTRSVFFVELLESINKHYKTGLIAPVFESIREFRSNKFSKTTEEQKGYSCPVYIKQAFNYLGKYDSYISRQYPKIAFELLEVYMQKHGKPDIIHAHFGIWAGWAALKIKEKYGIEYVLSEHSSDLLRGLGKSRKRRYEAIAENAKAISAVSTELANKIKQEYAVEVKVIPNVVDISKFNLKSKEGRGQHIISVNNHNANKNNELLINAFNLILKEYPKARLSLIGKGPETNRLKLLCSSLGIANKVEFKGQIPNGDLSKHYQEADLFALTSIKETFGVVLIEAMACGLPVVSTKSGGPNDIINENNGVLCTSFSAVEFSKALKTVLENIGKYDPEKIHNYVKNNFVGDAVVKKYSELYD